MFNNMGTSITEKLGLDSEVKELKFGSSFSQGSHRRQQGNFHSIKYDFKPASVDTSKMATLEVGNSSQVTISMPHYDNAGSTVFKGSTRPYTKECVLIIDKDTGEIVLEKLSHNVQVKKTRQEGSIKGPVKASSNSGSSGSGNSQPTASLDPNPGRSTITSRIDTSPSVASREFKEDLGVTKRGSSNYYSLNPGTGSGGKRPVSPQPAAAMSKHSPSMITGSSPLQHETLSKSSTSSVAFDALINKHSSGPSTSLPSLDSIEDLMMQPTVATLPTTIKGTRAEKEKDTKTAKPSHSHSNTKKASAAGAGELSDSSSGDESSSGSSSDDDDSSSASDMEEVPIPAALMGSSKKTLSSLPPPEKERTKGITSMPNLDVGMGSMPSHLLSEDLQLSEDSGSESD